MGFDDLSSKIDFFIFHFFFFWGGEAQNYLPLCYYVPLKMLNKAYYSLQTCNDQLYNE